VLRFHNGPELTAFAFTEWYAGRGIEARFPNGPVYFQQLQLAAKRGLTRIARYRT
jgi:hypothetical protein